MRIVGNLAKLWSLMSHIFSRCAPPPAAHWRSAPEGCALGRWLRSGARRSERVRPYDLTRSRLQCLPKPPGSSRARAKWVYTSQNVVGRGPFGPIYWFRLCSTFWPIYWFGLSSTFRPIYWFRISSNLSPTSLLKCCGQRILQARLLIPGNSGAQAGACWLRLWGRHWRVWNLPPPSSVNNGDVNENMKAVEDFFIRSPTSWDSYRWWTPEEPHPH